MFRKSIIAFALLGTSCFANSGTDEVSITGIGISEYTDTIYMGVTPAISQGDCTGKNQIRIRRTSEFSEMVYSAALTSMIASKKVVVGYNESGECINDNPEIITFYVKGS